MEAKQKQEQEAVAKKQAEEAAAKKKAEEEKSAEDDIDKIKED